MDVPFTGTVTITRNLGGSVTIGDGRISRSESGILRASVYGCNPDKDEEGEIIGWYPHGTVSTNAKGSYTLSGGGAMLTITASGSGEDRHQGSADDPSGMPTLKVNPARGRYSLGLPAGWLKGTREEVAVLEDPPHVDRKTSEWSGSIGLSVDEEVGLRIRDQPYSPGSGVISGSFTVVRQAGLGNEAMPSTGEGDAGPLPPEFAALSALPSFEATYTVTWSLSLKPGPKVRAVIETAGDYDHWIPTNDENRNTLTVKLRLVEPPGAKGYWTVKLDPSREPGECLNYPPPDQRDEKPDLVFASDQQANIDITEDRLTATSQDDEAELVVNIASKDWGAHGVLTAVVVVVTDSGLQEVEAEYKATGAPRLVMPRDDDNNHIADAWQKQHGVMGQDALWDEDDSPSTALVGDGLGLYEEYRGVHVSGSHHRLDPKTIDLFIYDQDGLVAASPVIAAFGPINIRLVSAAEMNMNAPGDERKRINFNTPRGDKFVTDQHGLHVVRGTIGPGVYDGETETSPPFGKAFPDARHAAPGRIGPPIETDVIVVDLTRIGDRIAQYMSKYGDDIAKERGVPLTAGWISRVTAATVSYIVVHEVWHGAGIGHHDPEESGAATCPMRVPGTNPRDYSLFAIATGRMVWGERYCIRCIASLSVSDKRRSR